jgi:hypothetical protein
MTPAEITPLNESEVLEMLANAVTACEELLQKAREAHDSFQRGDYIASADAIIAARGYGFFDDDYHLSHVRFIIESKKEQE